MLGHTPADAAKENEAAATCTEKGGYDSVVYCTVCHEKLSSEHTEIDALGHDFGEWTVSTPATCTEKGEETRSCARCDAKETREIAALGHTPGEAVKENEVAATCTEKGGYDSIVYCAVCHAELSREHTEIDALGHDFGEWTVTKEPTCTEKGEETRTCSRCYAKETRETAALGHDYAAVVTAPTCTEKGFTIYTCSHCGDSYVADYVDALGHDFGEWAVTKEPTCTEKGEESRTCSRCGEKETREIDALGHDYVAVVTAPTCTEKGFTTYTCSRCGDSYVADYVDALGHDFGEWTVTKEPTCTEKGEESRTCSRCGEKEAREIDALGHDYVSIVTAPTCTEKGFTTYNCSRCGDSYVADYVDALGHTPGEAVKENEVAATCTEQGGYDSVVYCTVCHAELSREHSELPALGHEWSEWTVTRPASCTEAGEESRLCARCLEAESRAIEAPGHDWGEPSYEWAEDLSSCTATRVCKRDESYIETETVAVTSEITLEPTVDAEGERTYTATFENPAFQTQTRTEAIDKLEPPAPVNPFVDVEESKFYYDAVLWALNAEPQITAGTSETKFSPNAGCTRAQVVTFLWRAAGCPEATGANNPFTDVTGGYYYDAVLWAVEQGITSGTSATKFSPGATCTRGQIVTFLWRFEGEPIATSANNPFTDVQSTAYYYKAVLWAAEAGVTSGTSATKFSPNATCTRAQVVTFLYRACAE